MVRRTRPKSGTLCAAFLIIAALLTAYVGMSAFGYLVPAVCLLLMAALVWFGAAGPLFKSVLVINLTAGALLVVVLAFGAPLGDRKLDVSGVALLVNLAAGGPLLGLVALPLLIGLRKGRPLSRWFGSNQEVTL